MTRYVRVYFSHGAAVVVDADGGDAGWLVESAVQRYLQESRIDTVLELQRAVLWGGPGTIHVRASAIEAWEEVEA